MEAMFLGRGLLRLIDLHVSSFVRSIGYGAMCENADDGLGTGAECWRRSVIG